MPSSAESHKTATWQNALSGTTMSVIIVTYNSEAYIGECLDRLHRQLEGFSAEIIVVDNNSADRTLSVVEARKKTLRLIRNPSNLGYAKACNIGASQSKSDYLLFLNPDTFCESDVVARILWHMKNNPMTAAAACFSLTKW